ncbi:acidic phospholipase A2 E-like isoform X1 [Biomphalaria glabrata]|uniref:Phospholipase A2 n=1 Tax=Biomphalaria glabrata TaxID=6526 RepID=A0A9W3AZK5_BIOGL|nr:acidic phospholipase A2 E-like isoform X1 [Biomphalaria glabrata]XP_055892654.1 acidic phospholipase A2 E-like isoform X1 [Biomphalaria glabrata]
MQSMYVVCWLLSQLLPFAHGVVPDNVISEGATTHHVKRRSLVLLCYQLDMTVGPSCLEYIGYGCYCGLGGQGTPVDTIDRCCQKHDICYSQVQCLFSWFTYFVHYDVRCSDGHCRCVESSDRCAYTSCECDRQLVECLKLAGPRNPKYMHYDRSKCVGVSATETRTNITSL